MANNRFMDNYLNKLEEKVEDSTKSLKEKMKEDLKKERNNVVKSLLDIYKGGVTDPPAEVARILGSDGGIYRQEDY